MSSVQNCIQNLVSYLTIKNMLREWLLALNLMTISNSLLQIILQDISIQWHYWSRRVNRFKKFSPQTLSLVPKKFCTYSPSPPAPRKMPPTASASHSLDTPMIMQPATMLSRAEPTRSPWYSPTLTGFIQQVEVLHLALTVTGNFTVICRSLAAPFSFTLSDIETLSPAEPPSQFSVAQDASCIFKDEAQVSIAPEKWESLGHWL